MFSGRSRILIVSLALYLAFITPMMKQGLYAQDTTTLTGSKAVWNLQQSLEYARRNNIQINTLRLTERSVDQQLLLSRSALLPDLFASGSQNLNHRRNQGNTVTGAYNLNSGWTLYRGGYLRSDIRQKDLAVQSANLRVLEEDNNITLQITSAYLNILLDKESIVYAEDLVKTSKSQLEQARRQYAAGSIARRDVVQFEAQLANDQYTLVTSQNAERQDLLNLRTLLQLPSGTSFDIVEPDTVLSEVVVTPLQEVQQYALQNRPEIRNSDLDLQIAELDLTKARAGYLPTLSASGSLGTTTGGNNTVIINNNAFSSNTGQFGRNFYQQAGITLSIPIFANRTNKTNVELAKINIEQAELDRRNTRITLSQEVEQAYINALNAQGQFNAAREQFRYNQEVFRISNEELRLGAANIFTFYQQRNLYIQALQNYIQAKYNAALSVSIYNFYSGIPITL